MAVHGCKGVGVEGRDIRRPLGRCRSALKIFHFVEYRLLEPRCGHRLLGARLRRDLLRRRAGLQPSRFSSSIVELPVNLLASFPELIHALPQAPRQVRQLFRPEENKNDEEDDK